MFTSFLLVMKQKSQFKKLTVDCSVHSHFRKVFNYLHLIFHVKRVLHRFFIFMFGDEMMLSMYYD